jgi:hypothetical protein
LIKALAFPLAAFLASSVVRAEFDSEKYLAYNLGRLSLRPQLEIAETYDSNIFFTDEDHIDDFYTSLRPGLRAVLGDLADNFFSFRYMFDASFYMERSDLDNFANLFWHQSRYRFTRLTIQGEDNLSLSRTLLGGTFSYIQRRIGRLSLNDNWRADYELSPRTIVGVKVNFGLVDYDEDDLEATQRHLYDYMSYGGGVRFGYLPSEKTVLFSEFTANQSIRERNTSNPQIPEAPDLNAYGVSLGAEGDFTPKLTGVVSAGYELRDYADNSDVPNGLIASAQLRWQARPKTSISLGYQHRIEVSRELLNASYTAHRPLLSIVQEVGTHGRWTVNLTAYYEFDDYEGEFLVDNQLVPRADNLFGVSARANYRWQPWLVASAGYDFFAFNTDLPVTPSYDYEIHRFSFRVAAGY